MYGCLEIITLPNGMVWIVGTHGDLWRIDCFRYKDKGGLVYLPTHSDAERKRYVFTVSLDMQGNEWVLTDKGYFVYGNNALKGMMLIDIPLVSASDFSWQIVETS